MYKLPGILLGITLAGFGILEGWPLLWVPGVLLLGAGLFLFPWDFESGPRDGEMKLIDVAGRLEGLSSDLTIYAAEPWTVDSEAVVALEPKLGGIPLLAANLGLSYFIEVSIAVEFLKGWNEWWLRSHGEAATAEQRCARLIEYAINDA